jgi:hypothetical protein
MIPAARLRTPPSRQAKRERGYSFLGVALASTATFRLTVAFLEWQIYPMAQTDIEAYLFSSSWMIACLSVCNARV